MAVVTSLSGITNRVCTTTVKVVETELTAAELYQKMKFSDEKAWEKYDPDALQKEAGTLLRAAYALAARQRLGCVTHFQRSGSRKLPLRFGEIFLIPLAMQILHLQLVARQELLLLRYQSITLCHSWLKRVSCNTQEIHIPLGLRPK
ncbi:hypothetical protein OZ401_004782 (plasmid) [Candidatus Chlorohelix allophototropha]|uniref:Uncharacterized protein n=1 Tax=Candidatus Chlorohelix allophototropha TaxID=3003348 RepID=A0ABY9BA31_9CHLR|nr:hypothetical protein OZ401_004782 [Chloroflexota bacterium L227-S17]